MVNTEIFKEHLFLLGIMSMTDIDMSYGKNMLYIAPVSILCYCHLGHA